MRILVDENMTPARPSYRRRGASPEATVTLSTAGYHVCVGDGRAGWWEYRKGQSTVRHYIPHGGLTETGSQAAHDDVRTLNGRNLSGRQVH